MSTTKRFTQEVVKWRPWVETVDDVGATPEQAELVAKVAPNPDSRPYYATLAHDIPALQERTGLFNAIMYGHGGASRADREFATVVPSRINGCVYCASVHARRYSQLTKDTALVQRLLDEGVGAKFDEHEQAIVDYAVKLTRDPEGLTLADLAPLRQASFADAQILDIAYATAMFAWANRLMQTLGESVLPEDGA
jgi:uncharacterized peroxidase-related enzyme